MSERNDISPEEIQNENGAPQTGDAQIDFAKKMQAIASDLWGSLSGGTSMLPGDSMPHTGKTAVGGMTTESRTSSDRMQPQREPKAAEQPEKKTDISHLWQTADETIDWTEALGHEHPTDGLTGQKLWDFYHRMAPKVLEGDLDAYVETLTTTNPLGDLTDYVNGMVIRTPSAERLECKFECRKELLAENAELYLGAMAVRISRDLFATLPVSEVYVEGNLKGSRKLGVICTRRQLLKRNPVFLDPAAFVKECGGVISTD